MQGCDGAEPEIGILQRFWRVNASRQRRDGTALWNQRLECHEAAKSFWHGTGGQRVARGQRDASIECYLTSDTRNGPQIEKRKQKSPIG